MIFIKGIILGFSIAAPVGPLGLLCIRRTLSAGMLTGFVSGIGTATADAVYGAIAAFGITAVAAFLVDQQIYFHFIGGIFLCYLGYTAANSEPDAPVGRARGASLTAAYFSAFLLTLTNPLTILAFAAAFAGAGIGQAISDYISDGIMVCGVFVGSVCWWLILSGLANYYRARLNRRRLKQINRLAGVIIAGFGIVCVLSI